MTGFKIAGNLHKVFPTENKSETFQTREFVISTQDGNYQQYIKFQLTQDRCQVIDPFKPGQKVTVHFDLRGREWQEKYFTNLNAWKVENWAAELQPVQPEEIEKETPDPTGKKITWITQL